MTRHARFGATVVEVGDGCCTTVLPDGAWVDAVPQDTPEYRATAARLGYGADTARMAVTHDAAHSALAAWLGLPHSPALHAVAHGEPDCLLHGLEEAAVMAVETYANALGIRLVDLWTR